MHQHPNQAHSARPKPPHAKTAMFIVSIIALIIAGVWIVTIPLTVLGIVYLAQLRDASRQAWQRTLHAEAHMAGLHTQLTDMAQTLERERYRNTGLQRDLDRLDALTIIEREHHIADLDKTIAGKRQLIDEHDHAIADVLAVDQRQARITELERAIEEKAQDLTAHDHALADVLSMSHRQARIRELEKQVAEKAGELESHNQALKDVLSMEQRQKRLRELNDQIQSSSDSLIARRKQVKEAITEVRDLRDKILDLQVTADVNDFGLYNFENPAQDSIRYGADLKAQQTQIKQRVKDKTATAAAQNFTLNGSTTKGQKMVNDMSKLLLRAFNSEAENCVKTVRAGNLTTGLKRLDRSAEAVQRLGKSMSIQITPSYLELRKSELRVTHAHMEALKEAREEERAARERAREEARAQKEFQAAKAKQEKEVEHYRTVLASFEAIGDEHQIERVTVQLTEAEEKLADVETTMANTRAGYVYVISNLGAFGRGMVKIGMTRRLKPDDRVRELGDSSVPFLFDKHALFFSQDAVGLETMLHQHFSDRRVNLVNLRREFFYATPAEVRAALIQHDAHMLEFHEPADAPEFTQSKLFREERGLPAVPPVALAGLMEAADRAS